MTSFFAAVAASMPLAPVDDLSDDAPDGLPKPKKSKPAKKGVSKKEPKPKPETPATKKPSSKPVQKRPAAEQPLKAAKCLYSKNGVFDHYGIKLNKKQMMSVPRTENGTPFPAPFLSDPP